MQDLKTTLTQFIANTLDLKEKDIQLTYPKYAHFGDYATSIALRLAKQIKKPPIQIAQEFADTLNKAKPPLVDKIEVQKPGFINIFLNYGYILNQLGELNLHGVAPSPLKIIIEHTSVNPNKALHIGHLRNAILGDTLYRLLKHFYKTIEVQNYIDDTGVQVADTVCALILYGKNPPKGTAFDDYCWDIYAKFHRQLKDPENKQKLLELREQVLKQIEDQEGEYYQLSQEVVHKILDHHLSELAKLQIKYDLLIHERDIIGFKLWDYAFELLKQKGKIKYFTEGKYKGCWVFVGDKVKTPKILVRSNGTKVYTAKDIAYHLWKAGALPIDFLYTQWKGTLYSDPNLYQTNPNGTKPPRTFGHGDKIINIIDYRQEFPQQVVKEAIEETLGKENVLYHLSYGVVSLSPKTAKALGIPLEKGKKAYPMSGRKGIGIKAKDLYKAVYASIEKKVRQNYGENHNIDINAITVASIRYQLLRYTVEREIIFDIDQATQFIGKTGPYLQYSLVRAVNILKKAGIDPSKTPNTPQNTATTNLNSEEKELIRQLSRFLDIIKEAATIMEPALIAEYAYNLSAAFNAFYEKNPVLSAKDKQTQTLRLYLVRIFANRLQDLLHILGIPAIEKM